MHVDDDSKSNAVVAVAERLDVKRPQEDPEADPRLVALHEPGGSAAEAFRMLYYSLRRAVNWAPLGVVGITSSARGDGRTMMAANLAVTAARETSRTVGLVDADLRVPNLHRLFGFDGEVGLSDVVANRADLDAALVAHGTAGIDLLAGGRPEPEPARRFTSPRFHRALSMLRQRYDEIFVDLPPMAFADARLLAPQCSGVVMVVRAGRTDRSLAQESLRGLEGARVYGIALNAASEVDAPVLRASRAALPGRK